MSCCGGCFKPGDLYKTETTQLKTKIDKELINRLQFSQEKNGMPSHTQVSEFIQYILTSMHVSAQSSKTITIYLLIYIERLISRTQNLNASSFICKKSIYDN